LTILLPSSPSVSYAFRVSLNEPLDEVLRWCLPGLPGLGDSREVTERPGDEVEGRGVGRGGGVEKE
jgi:hypothetical protein